MRAKTNSSELMVTIWRTGEPTHLPVLSIANWIVKAGKLKTVKIANNKRNGKLGVPELFAATGVNRPLAINLDAVCGGGAILIQYL
jgi:hypothetical protein